jgi:hypothetical protein
MLKAVGRPETVPRHYGHLLICTGLLPLASWPSVPFSGGEGLTPSTPSICSLIACSAVCCACGCVTAPRLVNVGLAFGRGGDHLPFPCKYASFSLHPYFSVFLCISSVSSVSYRILPYLTGTLYLDPYLSVSLRISPYFSVSGNTAGNFSTRLYFLRIFPYLSVF